MTDKITDLERANGQIVRRRGPAMTDRREPPPAWRDRKHGHWSHAEIDAEIDRIAKGDA